MTPGKLDDPIDELIFRYVANRCTAAERLELEGWLRRDAGNANRVEEMRRVWRASRPPRARDVDRMWTRLRAATEDRAASGLESDAPEDALERAVHHAALSSLAPRGFPAGVWAAAIAVLVGGGALFVSHTRETSRDPAAPRVYATGPAQTANVRLSDGSRVTLAPMSRLSVPDDFGRRERLVTVQGQGFFDVVHDAARPFRVRAKGAIAEDIGTRFDVRAYDEDSGVVVIVAEGAVTLGRARPDTTMRGAEGVVVRRGERGRLGELDSTTVVDRVSLRPEGWTEGRLSFVKAPLTQIARTIARWYDLEVRVESRELERRLVTADFSTQSPREMVEVLAIAVDGVVERHGRVLTIRAKP